MISPKGNFLIEYDIQRHKKNGFIEMSGKKYFDKYCLC